jgi:hypothetical protein
MFKVLMFYLFCEKMGREAQLLLLFSAAPPIAFSVRRDSGVVVNISCNRRGVVEERNCKRT